jgi:hypothetical protein
VSSNQIEGKIIKQAHKWDDHTIVTWDYEGANVIHFLGQEEGQYNVDFFYYLKTYCTRTYHKHFMSKLRI